MQKNSNFSRRDFLKSTTAGAAAISTGVWTGLAPAASKSANGKLNIACIGTANRAAADIDGVKGENIVALVDIDSNYLDRASANFPGARRYADYREMLESEDGKIDAVVIGTTDHHHAPASIRAIRKGLHVYCEKPLTHTVQEARIIAQEAKKHGVATQLGTQVHASDNYRRVVEIVQSGILGDVNEVHVWVGKGWGGGELPSDTQEPPKNLSWDLWLGPAPVRPFAAGRYHPAQWRRWWQFGQGTLGDMACHYMDLPFWALDLRHPTHCEAEGPEVHPETCPHGLTVRYQFPKRGKLVPVKLTWYDGNMIPKKVAGERVPGSGVMFVGTEGTMFANYGGYKLFPKEKFADFKPPKQTIPKSIGHHAEWIKACKDGSPTTCNFDYSGALTEAVLLGNVSYRAKSPLEWDAANLKATNCPAADKYISKEYRKGWEVS
ncbi:MAG: Gfo/Idh/MocA family oxidoreductase [Planctomycetes bacterium]|nr:Gfo/Idh/MocA family oxidoreductase [Planctomycetota bacterium]MCH9725265.1 Gfo/Idh/MocA family oxidoreductase [Planctomycetota bacterium]MCH9779515.1 Gfo/Idh/MocA family oxidoreductase [Planctomycetota bacterium]MCH9791617.1 Gfo/Idh/MocA family oxidoreductase [Planctomycetota bacterium]MDF1743005.1 Gfo/Idh/MocA family oxidoreductase [Gimesia sp.]